MPSTHAAADPACRRPPPCPHLLATAPGAGEAVGGVISPAGGALGVRQAAALRARQPPGAVGLVGCCSRRQRRRRAAAEAVAGVPRPAAALVAAHRVDARGGGVAARRAAHALRQGGGSGWVWRPGGAAPTSPPAAAAAAPLHRPAAPASLMSTSQPGPSKPVPGRPPTRVAAQSGGGGAARCAPGAQPGSGGAAAAALRMASAKLLSAGHTPVSPSYTPNSPASLPPSSAGARCPGENHVQKSAPPAGPPARTSCKGWPGGERGGGVERGQAGAGAGHERRPSVLAALPTAAQPPQRSHRNRPAPTCSTASRMRRK